MIAQVDKNYLKARPSAAIRRVVTRAFFEGRPITTKGRWFNTFVFAHFELEKRLPQLKQVEKPVFIVGTGRSGTTVLGTLFSMHPDVGFLSEPKAMWHSIYPYEDISGNYSKGPARYCLDERDVSPETREAAHHLFGAYLATTLSNRVVDKNPELVFRVPFVKTIFPDARFVFLVRNGGDTVNSIARWSDREGVRVGDEVHDWWGVNKRKWHLMVDELVTTDPDLSRVETEIRKFDNHLDMAVVEWIVTMRHGLKHLRKNADCMRLFRYEDIVGNPRQTLAELLSFCELPNEEMFLKYAEQRLRPAPDYAQVDIHPALAEPFLATLQEIGY